MDLYPSRKFPGIDQLRVGSVGRQGAGHEDWTCVGRSRDSHDSEHPAITESDQRQPVRGDALPHHFATPYLRWGQRDR